MQPTSMLRRPCRRRRSTVATAVGLSGRKYDSVPAVTAQGHTDSVKVFGWDLTKQAAQGIEEGWVVAVVQQDPAGEGKAAVDALMTLKKGGTVDPIINVPVTIVTKDNVAGFKSMFE